MDVVEGTPPFLFMDLGVRVGCGWGTGWWWGHVVGRGLQHHAFEDVTRVVDPEIVLGE